MNDYELGRRVESLERAKSQYLFIGYGCIIFAFIWFFFSVWDLGLGLLAFGVLGLIAGYSNKDELDKLKKQKNE